MTTRKCSLCTAPLPPHTGRGRPADYCPDLLVEVEPGVLEEQPSPCKAWSRALSRVKTLSRGSQLRAEQLAGLGKEMRYMRVQWTPIAMRVCSACGGRLPQSRGGRPRLYCSTTCANWAGAMGAASNHDLVGAIMARAAYFCSPGRYKEQCEADALARLGGKLQRAAYSIVREAGYTGFKPRP